MSKPIKVFKSCKIELSDYNKLVKLKASTGQPISRLISNAINREYKGAK